MMEKLYDDAHDWEQRHLDTWMGRHGGTFGGAVSAQADLMSPMGFIDFTNDPSTFNLAKSLYSPGIAMGCYSIASMLSGQKIYFAERVMHTADMAKRTAVFAGRQAGRAVKIAFNPYTLMAGAFAYAMYWGHDRNPLLMLGIPSGL